MINALIIICAYLIGSIPSALWIGKIFYKTDIRQQGSGNLGTTNTFRVLGKKPGIAVLLIDILKGTAAVLLPLLPFFADSTVHPLFLGVIAAAGHMFPIFASFRGGKAVATSGGVILGYNLPLFLILIIVFVIALKLTKMVSLSSMIVSAVAVIYVIVHWMLTGEYALLILVVVLAGFIFYRHRENIKRIKAGTEPKIKGF
ncbi:glycerol-3-phosphate 1-O-acyltransferase PlsY [Solibacillus sp. FSL W7-1472]|uniref:Glycerol-3-phosphate acyltransferase n=2 Tax=Solibacillus TaxID=648800 RepID=F2F5R6_SOLSS|nr:MULTISPECIES: glycerol-3-phosphate 1-O-acyltransferase PlsY [Solibacillus]AMO85484.1 glycerol-3-phosphate acyltransferase [Solibacillus silvestris]EKB43450.1 G3P acyltransferase [Solibacillus isronensis B3W22]OBW60509.1 acyl-phosphate glycerol 3-phosphate acyltransferase [Solibacillus silvestris]BAK16599.1 predicted membrane protein [Solibacillus silvestris StLB046]